VAETVEQSFLRPLQQCARRVIVFSIFRPSEGKVRLNLTFMGLRNGHTEWRVTGVD
jgi:hypothetical protein